MMFWLKKLLGLNISDEEQKILDALNASTVTRRVIGRGTLILNVSELYETEKFKRYQRLARSICK